MDAYAVTSYNRIALPTSAGRAEGEGAAKRRMGGRGGSDLMLQVMQAACRRCPPSVSQLRCDPPSPSTR